MNSIFVPIMIAACLFVSAANAENRVITFTNNTQTSVEALYGSTVEVDSWQEDLLGDTTLAAGEAIDVDFDDGSGDCRFDFKALFSDHTDGYLKDVDVCEVGTISIE
ncbi:hypothetical protein [Paracoccus aminophilus]|uniref:Argininosuccinate lyase n=1 Tax=Paracoccus aminophilus JCM 7686 TaxID=1367847 RepID=S5XYG9_PARAH|nr:hypothetical protein [Paracoccus aminophilus]AGT08480.1 hypothetical protein JCM7686_1379 [Paracoccus aminophilus JCM 7686]